MRSGISNTLAKVETTIVIDDDIVPLPRFFPYCQELLSRYREDERIFLISGNNLLQDDSVSDGSCGIGCGSCSQEKDKRVVM